MSTEKKVYTAIGLMSGTSLDGIDAALIETDGHSHIKPLGFMTRPYDEALRETLRACFGKSEIDEQTQEAERLMTLKHAEIILDLLSQHPGVHPDIIGFHGQTILHDIENKKTIQIGDAKILARETGIDVAYDFRSADVEAGGQGAPLAPLYHQARAKADNLDLPTILLNIGGVANITYIDNEDILAFDTGPGNALMDDYMKAHTGQPFDKNGHTAAQGTANQKILERWMAHPYFSQKPPKSLDRNEWDIAALGPLAKDLQSLKLEDALATLMAFSVRGIAAGFDHLAKPPKHCYACGGGRLNETMMVSLNFALDCTAAPVETLSWDGDATEAECFAYLAVRSLLGLPISLPTTTGVQKPLSGGKRIKA